MKLRNFDFYESSYWNVGIDDLVTIRKEIKKLGHLDNSFCHQNTSEAFIEFELEDDTLNWLEKNFEFVSEIIEEEKFHPITIHGTKSFSNLTSKRLAEWLWDGNKKSSWINLMRLKAAILYENSD